MKALIAILFALIFSFTIFGQVAKPAPTADASTSQVHAIVLSKEEESILAEIEVNERIMSVCTDGGVLDCKKVEKATGDLYSRIIRFPNVVSVLLARSAIKYQSMREGATGAVQVSQIADEQNVLLNRIIVVQNQRIIELLEKLVNKK